MQRMEVAYPAPNSFKINFYATVMQNNLVFAAVCRKLHRSQYRQMIPVRELVSALLIYLPFLMWILYLTLFYEVSIAKTKNWLYER